MSIEGKTIVFTGRISKPRHEFEKLIRENGAFFGTSVTRNTDYLVVGEEPGSKLGVATLLGTTILTEQDLLALIAVKEEKEDKPMSKEAFEAITVLLECKWCGKPYRQWDTMPNRKTCPLCEFRARVSCPHCTNELVTYVEDYNLYNCNCGQWFEAPYSSLAHVVKHLHMWMTTSIQGDVTHKKCVTCGWRIKVPTSDQLVVDRNYRMYPIWMPQWRAEHEARQKDKEVEQQTLEWYNSLTSEQKEELKRQLRKETN